MTLIGEVPPGLAATAARIGDAGDRPRRGPGHGRSCRSSSPAHPFDGRSVCVLVPDAHPHLPAAAAAARGARRAARAGQPADGADRAGHARADGRGGAGRPPRLRARAAGGDLSRHHRGQPRVVEARDVRRPRHRSRRPGSSSCPRAGWTWTCRCCSTARSSSTTSRWCVGPVLPHEVVGISGGNKYFFPGVGGQKIIDVSHWLGALITSAEIIGTTGITPVRALIDDGAALIPSEKLAFCAVTAEVADGAVDGAVDAAVTSPVRTSGLHSVSFGDTRASWASAARGLRGDPRDLPGRAGPPGAVDHPRDVRRHLDRRQGLLQARAGRRRRRRGDPLRPAHHARSPRRTRRSTRSATTAATTS